MKTITHRKVVGVAAATALALTLAGCSFLGGAPRDDSGKLTAAASLSLSALKVGDCIADVNALGETVTRVAAVPCTTTHNGEVFGVTNQGATYLRSVAEAFCVDEFAKYVGVDHSASVLDVLYYSPKDASSTDKTVTCMAYHKDGSTDVASIKGSKK